MTEEHFNILYKKLANEINQSENEKFNSWLNESPENELFFRRLKDAWGEDLVIPMIKGQKSAFERISKLIDLEEQVEYTVSKRNSFKISRIWYGVAAAVIAVITFASILYYEGTSDESRPIAALNSTIKTNPAGQKTRINLPDGSVCWLNSDSKIQYLSNFSDSARNIHLIGEAYFEVARNPDKPFKVHTPNMTVTALGTIFNITSFPDETSEMVALVEGKILVEGQNGFDSEVLPGEAVQFNKASMNSSKFDTNVNDIVAWKNGELILEELNYETIFKRLERWYGVDIKITGAMPEELKYKARFNNQNLKNVLESIKYGREWDYSIDGKNVEIMFN